MSLLTYRNAAGVCDPLALFPKRDGLLVGQTADATVFPVSRAPEGRATGTGGMKMATASAMARVSHGN